eukprot:4265414-Prymnesium_polylepis.1
MILTDYWLPVWIEADAPSSRSAPRVSQRSQPQAAADRKALAARATAPLAAAHSAELHANGCLRSPSQLLADQGPPPAPAPRVLDPHLLWHCDRRRVRRSHAGPPRAGD